MRPERASKIEAYGEIFPYTIFIKTLREQVARDAAARRCAAGHGITCPASRPRPNHLSGLEQTAHMKTQGLPTEAEVGTQLSARDRLSTREIG